MPIEGAIPLRSHSIPLTLHGISVMLSVVCRDDSLIRLLYLTTQGGLVFPSGTFIPTNTGVVGIKDPRDISPPCVALCGDR